MVGVASVRVILFFAMAGSWKKIKGALSPENIRSAIFNPENSMILMVTLFVMEIFINVWVIQNINCKLSKR